MAVRRISLGRAVLELDTDLDPLLEGLGKGEKAVKQFGANTNLLGGTMAKVFGGVTLANIAAKVVSFGADLLRSAGSLQDLHERTMVSVESLQRLSVIAEQSGSSIDSVATAIFQMGKRLAGGDDSAVAALEELGLRFAEIRHMRPEDAFDAIGRALGALDDPMKRAELGAKIFGRSVDDLMPTFVNLSKETGSYLTLSARQVALLDAIGDAFVRVKASIVPLVVKMIDMVLQVGRAVDAWKAFFGVVNPDETTDAFKRMTASMKANTQAVKDRAAKVLTGAALDAKAKEAIEEIKEALEAKTKRVKEAKDATEKHNEVMKRMHTEILKIENVLPGLSDQIGYVDDSVLKLGDQIRALTKDLSAVERHGWSTAGVMREFAGDLQKLGDQVDAKQIHEWAQEWAFTGPILEDVEEKSVTLGGALDEVTGGIAKLAQISGDSFGGVAKDIGKVVATASLIVKAMEAAATATTTFGKAMATAQVYATVFVIAGTKLYDILSQGSKAASKYADEMDGLSRELGARFTNGTGLGAVRRFEGLEKAAKDAGISMERFNAALKMPTGNQEEAKLALLAMREAVDEINAAFDRQKLAQDTLIETMGRYKFSVEELGPALSRQKLSEQSQQLYKDWQVLTEAGIDVASVGREMADSINAFLQSAIKTGAEVDIAMKPMLQKMVDMGLIVDEDGKKLKDLKGIKFSETMSEGFTRIVDAVKILTDTIRIGLGLAIAETADKIKKMPDVHVRVRYDDPGAGIFDFQPAATPMAAGGMGRVTTPTLFLAGEGGPEDFAFSGAGQQFGGGGPVTTILELDGAVLARVVTERQDRDFQMRHKVRAG